MDLQTSSQRILHRSFTGVGGVGFPETADGVLAAGNAGGVTSDAGCPAAHEQDVREDPGLFGPMTVYDGKTAKMGPRQSASPGYAHASGNAPRITSIPLKTALTIARERQRSKSSRRKIFREEPDRYLDIVHLMRERRID